MHSMEDEFLEVREVVLLGHDEEGAQDGRNVLDWCVESVGVKVLEKGEGDGVGFCEIKAGRNRRSDSNESLPREKETRRTLEMDLRVPYSCSRKRLR